MKIITLALGAALAFNDLWLTRIKPEPYPGVATTFDDRYAFDGSRLAPYDAKRIICAHMLEAIGQRLRVTNTANGKSVICTVRDRGPNRRFWPRREVDLSPPGDRAIGCDGMCDVKIERVPQ